MNAQTNTPKYRTNFKVSPNCAYKHLSVRTLKKHEKARLEVFCERVAETRAHMRMAPKGSFKRMLYGEPTFAYMRAAADVVRYIRFCIARAKGGAA